MIETNLIPISLRTSRSRQRRIKAWGISVMAALFLLLIPVFFDQYLRVEASRLTVQSQELGEVLTGLRQRLATMTSEAERSFVQLQRAQALRSKRAWSAMFTIIGENMPDGCWLTSIATDPSSPTGGVTKRRRATAKGKTNVDDAVTKIEAPQRLKIVGFASNASEPYEFVSRLKMAEIFRDVSLETSRRERVQDAWAFRFDLVCEW